MFIQDFQNPMIQRVQNTHFSLLNLVVGQTDRLSVKCMDKIHGGAFDN